MNRRSSAWVRVLLAGWLVAMATVPVHAAEQADEEVRNTVINLLESLVQKGVLTREQAQALVNDARQKAAATAEERAAQQAAVDAAEKNAVRVPYIPQVIRDQIAAQVSEEVRPQVTEDVVKQAKGDSWGMAAALPEWARNIRLQGDVRFRAEGDWMPADNAQGFYVDFGRVNSAGGIGKAGATALLNTTEDRRRLVGRLRFGAVADLASSLKAEFRLASGSASNPVSTNQTLGTWGQRWTLGVDRAGIAWTPLSASHKFGLDVRAGRFENPFASGSELVWDSDLSFDGVSAGWRWNRLKSSDLRPSRWLFATVAAMPLQEVELSDRDKWLLGGQLGAERLLQPNTLLRLAAGYYDFIHVTGRLNAPDSQLLDFTAPSYLTKGNTLFDIRNDTDTGTNLYALAGKYRLITGLLQLDVGFDSGRHLVLSGEYVKNIGWKTGDVLARTGAAVDARTQGYDVNIAYGQPDVRAFGQWRATVGYRYLQRDAVLDSFTDSDFHLGGTDAKGYSLQLDFGLTKSAFARMRYLSANEIDGAPLGIDVLQLDIIGRF